MLRLSYTRLCNRWLRQAAVSHDYDPRVAHRVKNPHGTRPSLGARLIVCLRQVIQKAVASILPWTYNYIGPRYRSMDLISPRIDKIVSCVVTDSRCENEDKLFVPVAAAMSLEFSQQSQTNKQKTHSNRRVRHIVRPPLSRPFHMLSSLTGRQSAPRVFHSRFPR